jgi:hypothetical protein
VSSAPAEPAIAPARLPARATAALRAVLVPFVGARIIVLAALALAHLVVSRDHPSPATAFRVHQGLLAWDAGFYETIARVGYAPLGHQALRFFPLFPLAARALAWLPGVDDGVAVVLIANLGALIGTALLVALVRRETGDEALASRSAWLFSLAPPAFTLVLGYAEGLLLVCTTACFLCLRPAVDRRPSWWWAAAFAYAGALTRPLGVLLVLPVAVEALRRWKGAEGVERLGILTALVGPVAGLATFLGWSAAVDSDFWLPLRVQTSAGHHGGLSDPFHTLLDDAKGAFHHHFGTALHVPWVVLVVIVLVFVWRRLPACYGAFATGVVLVALSGTNLDSFERYALSAFPLVMVGAMGLASRRVERAVLVLSAAGLFAYALLAFLNLSVP